MKFIITKKEFNDVLNIVSKSAGTDGTIITSGVYFEALNNEEILVKTTNAEMEIETTLKAIFDYVPNKEDAMCIPCQMLKNLISNLKDGEIEITTFDNKKTVEIKSDKFKTELGLFDVSDFPMFGEKLEDENKLNVSQGKLKEAFIKTAYAVSKDTSRPIFTGVYFDISQDGAFIVATDAHRLGCFNLCNSNLNKELNDNNFKQIIPGKFISLLLKDMANKDEDVIELTSNKSYLKFKFIEPKTQKQVIYKTFFIKGEYPNWGGLFPSVEAKTTLTLNCKDLEDTLKRLLAVSELGTIEFNYSKETLNLSTRIKDISTKAEEDFECSLKSGEEFSVAVNGNFLIDYLKRTKSQDIQFKFYDNMKPVVILEYDKANNINDEFKYIVMPIRLR